MTTRPDPSPAPNSPLNDTSRAELAEARLGLAMDAAQMGIWEWTIATGQVTWSPTLEAIHGLAPGTFGGGFEDFKKDIHPDDCERVLARVRESLEQRTEYRIEYRIIRPSGAICWIESRGKVFVDAQGNPEKMMGVCMEKTARKREEAAHSRLAALVESSHDAIISKTLQGIVTTWNTAAERIFGYVADEMVGRSITVLIPPERANEEREILARIECGETIQTYETIRMRKDGTLLNVALTISPIKDSSGTIVGASKIARDITERKQIEAEREHLVQELHHANAAKDHFIAVLSHELRTPLNPVLMTVTDLERDESIAPAVREQLTVVRRNVELEARLIDDLLDSTRIASGKLQLQRTIVDAAELMCRATAIVEGEARTKGVRLEMETCPQACPVDGDPARLQQVIWNVVKNAVKFTPEGGRVQLRCDLSIAGRMRILVEDNGIGIAAEDLERIFTAFEQGDPQTSHRFGGLGLGLSISKALVTMHGGTLTAHSEGRGRGATFVIDLPLVVQAPAEEVANAAPSALHRTARLLVVEDHEATARVMIRLLTKRGYAVSAAASIQEALTVLKETPVDVLISDVGLPDGSGRELMQQARQFRALPGIALSGYGTDADVAQSREAGFSAHLTKPVDIDRLDEEIQRLTGSQ